MTGKVVMFPGVQQVEGVTAEQVFECSKEAQLKDVIVVGWNAEGGTYFNSNMTPAEVVFLLELAKLDMLRLVDSMAGDHS